MRQALSKNKGNHKNEVYNKNSEAWGKNSLAGKMIYAVVEVTVAAIHTVGLLCVVAFSGVA